MSKPRILSTSILAKSRLFRIEALEMGFSNGKSATFECLRGEGEGVVMVAAVNENNQLILVREYAACVDRYELGFVKGKIDPGETPLETADRELKEEIGYGANQLEQLKKVYTSPGYNDFTTYLYCATVLHRESEEGDEAEPLEQVLWPIEHIAALFQHPEVNDVRVLFLLTMLEKKYMVNAGERGEQMKEVGE